MCVRLCRPEKSDHCEVYFPFTPSQTTVNLVGLYENSEKKPEMYEMVAVHGSINKMQ